MRIVCICISCDEIVALMEYSYFALSKESIDGDMWSSNYDTVKHWRRLRLPIRTSSDRYECITSTAVEFDAATNSIHSSDDFRSGSHKIWKFHC